MLHILHVLESLNAGGMETTFVNMLRVFRRLDRHVVHDVLAFQSGPLHAQVCGLAGTVTIAPDTATIDAVLARGCDLVHILFERCAYRLFPRLTAKTAVPIVYGKGYDMGGMYRLNDGLLWQPDESMLVAADAVTFTTPHLAAGYAVPDGRVTVLRKAADTTAFGRLQAPRESTPLRIVAVANLHPRKRLGDLIDAFAMVLRRHPQAELRLVGGGDPAERMRLEALVDRRGLRSSVTFAGHRPDVAAELVDARVLALPSSCEGVPTAVIEAMAAGRAVVATRTGHIDSVIDDGVDGYLVAVGDIQAMADRLIDLLAYPDHAMAMGARARVKAASHGVDIVAADLLSALTSTAVEARRQLSMSSPARLAG